MRDDVSDLLRTLVWIADENAREVRERRWSRGAPNTEPEVDREWDAFVNRLEKRRSALRLAGDPNADDLDLDEDDLDNLATLVRVLGNRTLTVSEVVLALQRERVLSIEFQASARAQAKRMLAVLRQVNRVWCDDYGRWSLLD